MVPDVLEACPKPPCFNSGSPGKTRLQAATLRLGPPDLFMTRRPAPRPMPTLERTTPDQIDLRLELSPNAEAPSRAREALSALEPELTLDEMISLGLAVSELVTNGVRHSGAAPGARIGLRVALTPDLARVEVTDPGRGFDPEVRAGAEDDLGGWGLFLVDQLARRWWVEGGSSTRVICELARA